MPSPHLRRYIARLIAAGSLVSGIFAIPAGAQGRPKMDDEPKPFAKFSASALSIRDSIVAFTKRQVGIHYRLGASSPETGFDCSGLAKYVMAHFNIALPRTSREQALAGQAIARDISVLRPGDLLTFGKGKRVSHVGIYIGDGKFIHAPNRHSEVREGSLFSARTARWWKGARRVIAFSDTSPLPPDTISN